VEVIERNIHVFWERKQSEEKEEVGWRKERDRLNFQHKDMFINQRKSGISSFPTTSNKNEGSFKFNVFHVLALYHTK
jgi:hypothetical protein